MNMQNRTTLAGLLIIGACIAGCSDSGYQDYSEAPLSDDHGHSHDHDHEHSRGLHEGKHGGHVLELDDAHGHHAEMIFDKTTRDVTLYFYGSEIGVAKSATGLAFEIEKDDKEVVLEATPSPLEGETNETCSRYVISGSQFPPAITSEEQLNGHFHVTIDGKEFVGSFHAHGHEEHEDGDHSTARDHADAHNHKEDAEPMDGEPEDKASEEKAVDKGDFDATEPAAETPKAE